MKYTKSHSQPRDWKRAVRYQLMGQRVYLTQPSFIGKKISTWEFHYSSTPLLQYSIQGVGPCGLEANWGKTPKFKETHAGYLHMLVAQ